MPVRLFVGVPWLLALPLLAVYGAFWILVVMFRFMLVAVSAVLLAAMWLYGDIRPRQ